MKILINIYHGNIGDKKLIRAGFEEKLYDTGQIKLNYVVGPDNGPNLLLIPAQMGTWESYGKVLIPLSQQFKVYAIDIRGHGKSSWTPGDYSWSTIGQDMRSFIDNVVQGKVIIREILQEGLSLFGVQPIWVRKWQELSLRMLLSFLQRCLVLRRGTVLSTMVSSMW